MTKELEALERLKTAPNFMGGTTEYKSCTKSETLLIHDYEIIKQALQRLEVIENIKSSEALNDLDKINEYLNNVYDYKEVKEEIRKDINTIKQALLKAQKDAKIIFGIEDYINLRIRIEPAEDIRKAFIEIRDHLGIVKEVVNNECNE